MYPVMMMAKGLDSSVVLFYSVHVSYLMFCLSHLFISSFTYHVPLGLSHIKFKINLNVNL